MYGGYTSYFTRIAVDSLETEISTRNEIKTINYKTQSKYKELLNLHYKWLSNYFTCLIFSSFALESYINGYGVRRLTSSYYKEYLEKLSLESKWIIVPRLVTGRSIYGSEGHRLLKILIKVRNGLAHDKPKHKYIPENVDIETAMTYYDGGKDIEKEITALDSIKTIIELNNKLIEIDEESKIFQLVDPYLQNKWAKLNYGS